MNYMYVTAHSVDSSWKIQKRILSFCCVSDHKGPTITRELEECMFEWDTNKILTITVDNFSANDRIQSLVHISSTNSCVVEQLKWRKLLATPVVPGTIVYGHEFIHMRCCAHILN